MFLTMKRLQITDNLDTSDLDKAIQLANRWCKLGA